MLYCRGASLSPHHGMRQNRLFARSLLLFRQDLLVVRIVLLRILSRLALHEAEPSPQPLAHLCSSHTSFAITT